MAGQFAGIVVGYDGSPHSEVALDWAAAEAEQRGLPLSLICLVDFVGMFPGMPGTSTWPSRLEKKAQEVVQQGVERAKKIAESVAVQGFTRPNQAAGALIDLSREATLVVVGTRGRGAVAGAAFGSVAFAVSAYAHCPVVVVRGDGELLSGPKHPVVVGVDGSSGSDAAVRYASSVAAATGATLSVITACGSSEVWVAAEVYGQKDPVGSGFETIAEAAARQVTQAAARIARELHPDLVVTEKAVPGPPVQVLAAATQEAGLLVLGSRGRGGFTGLLLGSVGHGSIHVAACPVVIVHAQVAGLPT